MADYGEEDILRAIVQKEEAKQKPLKTALIVISDLHIGSTLGLCPLSVILDEGNTVDLNPIQHNLLNYWDDMWGKIKSDSDGCERVLVLNGDIGELDTKKRSVQLITHNKATVLKMCVELLDKPAQLVDRVYVVRGTAAHTGKSSWLEEEIAEDIDNCVKQSEGTASHWHIRGTLAGVGFDIAHHASLGSTPWSAPNSANTLAAKTLWYYQVARNEKPPNVVVRSHNHRYADSGGNYPVFACFTPAWQAITEHGYRSGYENALSDIGGLMFICEDGKYTLKRYQYTLEKDKRLWKMSL